MQKALQVLEADVNQAKAQLSAQTINAPGMPGATFCTAWPVARVVLKAMGASIGKIAWLIDIIIGVGDKICGSAGGKGAATA